MTTLFAWLKANSVDVELNKLLLLMSGFFIRPFAQTTTTHCVFEHFLLARSVACFLISCKLFEVTVPSTENCLKVLNQLGVMNTKEFASLVWAEEKMIVRDCGWHFLYLHADDNGKEEHLHSLFATAFDGRENLFGEVLLFFLHTQHRSVRWPMLEMWRHINQLSEKFPVQKSTAIHAYMATFMAWQKMKLWDSNLSL